MALTIFQICKRVVNYRLSYEEQRTKASLVKGRGTA